MLQAATAGGTKHTGTEKIMHCSSCCVAEAVPGDAPDALTKCTAAECVAATAAGDAPDVVRCTAGTWQTFVTVQTGGGGAAGLAAAILAAALSIGPTVRLAGGATCGRGQWRRHQLGTWTGAAMIETSCLFFVLCLCLSCLFVTVQGARVQGSCRFTHCTSRAEAT